MIVIGVDAHKATHTCAAVQELTGRQNAIRTAPARDQGHGQLLDWARGLGRERVWAIEDCRQVSGRLERFLLGHGERIIRVPPKLTASARKSSREPGKSDAIDALAVARAAIEESIDSFPVVVLDERALEIRQLVDHRERLVWQRTALINDLRWHLHDLDPEFAVPARHLTNCAWQQKTLHKLSRMRPNGHVRVDAMQNCVELRCRLPPRSRRWRSMLPELALSGATPAIRANFDAAWKFWPPPVSPRAFRAHVERLAEAVCQDPGRQRGGPSAYGCIASVLDAQ
jgi:hypothetical protein